MINHKTYDKQFKYLILVIIIVRQGIREKTILDELSNLSFFEKIQKKVIGIISCHDIS